jgi:hypothetical protein
MAGQVLRSCSRRRLDTPASAAPRVRLHADLVLLGGLARARRRARSGPARGVDCAAMVREGRALVDVRFAWRGEVTDDELVTLTQSHGGAAQPGWWNRIRPHSLGWVTARAIDGALIGFVNVAWDGGDHAFLIDTKVRPTSSGAASAPSSCASQHGTRKTRGASG